jgi:MFS family permease
MSPFSWASARLRALPPTVRAMLLGSLVNRFGNGLVLPYILIYLHNQRGATLTLSGLLVGMLGLVGLLMSYVAGEIVDRFGRTRAVITSLALSAAGYLIVGSPVPLWGVAAGMLLAGLGNGLFWPAQKALLASST